VSGGKCLLGLGSTDGDDLPVPCSETDQADHILLGKLDWFTAFLDTCLLICFFYSSLTLL